MRKTKLAAVLATVLSMAACGNSAQSTTTQTIEDVAVSESTTTEAVSSEEASTVEETTIAEEAQTDGSDMQLNDVKQLFGKSCVGNSKSFETEIGSDLLPESNIETGYLTDDMDELNESLESDFTILELSQAMMDESDGNGLYFFTMYNEDSVQEVPASDGSVSYMTQLIYDEEEFYVLFGDDTITSYDEVLPYCEEDTTLDYWAIGIVKDGDYFLVPVFAGNEETGYYIVRSVMEMFGEDMSDMLTLEEQGISFRTGDSNKKASSSAQTEGDDFYFEITSIEQDEESITVNYDLTSNYAEDVYIRDEVITLNGEDITEDTITFFTVDANDTISDCFYIDNYDLKIGDEIVIDGILVNNNTMEDIGTIKFPLILEEVR